MKARSLEAGCRGDEIGRERAQRRPREGARNAEQCRDDVQRRVASSCGVHANQASAAAQPSSSATDARAIHRRSSRSAVQPVTRVSRNSGTNCTRPMIPRRNAASLRPIVCAGDVIDLPADDDDHRHLPMVQLSRASQKERKAGIRRGSGSKLTRARLAQRRWAATAVRLVTVEAERLISHGIVSP